MSRELSLRYPATIALLSFGQRPGHKITYPSLNVAESQLA